MSRGSATHWTARVSRRLGDPRLRGCLGKVAHPTYEAAEAARHELGPRWPAVARAPRLRVPALRRVAPRPRAMSSAVTVRRCKYGWRVYAGGRRLRKVRPCYSRDVYVGEGLAVKLEPWEHARQNRREAEALEDQEIRAAAAESGVILPELVEVGPDHQWIAVTHLALHRPRSARRREMYARVRRVMKVAQRCDHQEEYWNWAMVGDQPAIYDLGV